MTRTLLLAIFLIGLVAQFVKPVGDALEGKVYIGGALLSLVGYLLYAEVQRLNAAYATQREGRDLLLATARRWDAEVQRLSRALGPREGSMVTPEELKAEFKKALEAGGNVDFAVMGFTGETFVRPVKKLLERTSPNAPRAVRLRILLPDFTRPMEVPGLVRAGKVMDAPGFRRSLRQQIAGYRADLEGLVDRLEARGWGTLSVEFRVMHMSPSLKLYLVNNDRVFEGIYDKIELRPNPYGTDDPEPSEGRDTDKLLDLLGYDSLLTRWHGDDGERARDVIGRRRRLFDTFWDAAREWPDAATGIGGG
ncbi:ATP/GTP-binding protein [Streptomyces sp. NPDC008313]|uniref:ATP/GTP-binding protein n=1 Tax=Streptomyces sp. NPDC008313 TaxID=3364826 RepID=UPI0036E9CE3C